MHIKFHFSRTIQARLERHFAAHGGIKTWVHELRNTIINLNATVHSSTNKRPIDVTNANSRELYLKIRNKRLKEKRQLKPKYRVGDLVRIPRTDLGKFAKGAVAKWTEKLFKIIKIDIGQLVPMYYVADNRGAVYPRRLYEKQINKVSNILFQDF